MSRRGVDDLGFTIISTPKPGSDILTTVGRFRCVECAGAIDIPVPRGIPLHPEGLAKRATQRGWTAHPHRKSVIYCDRCSGPRKTKNDTDSELKKVTPVATPPTPREITPDTRLKIRNLLEKHFDDSTGMYLDGMDDQKIAEAVSVPRIKVEQIREIGYGPIRVDPVMAALRNELAMIRRDVDAHLKALDAIKGRLSDAEARAQKIGKVA